MLHPSQEDALFRASRITSHVAERLVDLYGSSRVPASRVEPAIGTRQQQQQQQQQRGGMPVPVARVRRADPRRKITFCDEDTVAENAAKASAAAAAAAALDAAARTPYQKELIDVRRPGTALAAFSCCPHPPLDEVAAAMKNASISAKLRRQPPAEDECYAFVKAQLPSATGAFASYLRPPRQQLVFAPAVDYDAVRRERKRQRIALRRREQQRQEEEESSRRMGDDDDEGQPFVVPIGHRVGTDDESDDEESDAVRLPLEHPLRFQPLRRDRGDEGSEGGTFGPLMQEDDDSAAQRPHFFDVAYARADAKEKQLREAILGNSPPSDASALRLHVHHHINVLPGNELPQRVVVVSVDEDALAARTESRTAASASNQAGVNAAVVAAPKTAERLVHGVADVEVPWHNRQTGSTWAARVEQLKAIMLAFMRQYNDPATVFCHGESDAAKRLEAEVRAVVEWKEQKERDKHKAPAPPPTATAAAAQKVTIHINTSLAGFFSVPAANAPAAASKSATTGDASAQPTATESAAETAAAAPPKMRPIDPEFVPPPLRPIRLMLDPEYVAEQLAQMLAAGVFNMCGALLNGAVRVVESCIDRTTRQGDRRGGFVYFMHLIQNPQLMVPDDESATAPAAAASGAKVSRTNSNASSKNAEAAAAAAAAAHHLLFLQRRCRTLTLVRLLREALELMDRWMAKKQGWLGNHGNNTNNDDEFADVPFDGAASLCDTDNVALWGTGRLSFEPQLSLRVPGGHSGAIALLVKCMTRPHTLIDTMGNDKFLRDVGEGAAAATAVPATAARNAPPSAASSSAQASSAQQPDQQQQQQTPTSSSSSSPAGGETTGGAWFDDVVFDRAAPEKQPIVPLSATASSSSDYFSADTTLVDDEFSFPELAGTTYSSYGFQQPQQTQQQQQQSSLPQFHRQPPVQQPQWQYQQQQTHHHQQDYL